MLNIIKQILHSVIYNIFTKRREGIDVMAKYSAKEVAAYIINYSLKKEHRRIDNLKLQKLLYYIQAYFLCNTKSHSQCFSDTIEAWSWGPVVPNVYREYKVYGASGLPKVEIIDTEYEFFNDNLVEIPISFDPDKIFSPKDRENIEKVIDAYKDYSSIAMMKKTHQEDPWIKARKREKKEILLEDIREYYGNN